MRPISKDGASRGDAVKGAGMALKELEQLTRELGFLVQQLRGEVVSTQRHVLIKDIQRLLNEIKKGAHG